MCLYPWASRHLNLARNPRVSPAGLLSGRALVALNSLQFLDEIRRQVDDYARRTVEERKAIAGLIPARADVILANMEPEEARTARRLAAYPGDLAGGLMIAEFLHYPAHATVQDVVDDIRAKSDRYASYDVQYAYVTARDGRLVGVLALRDPAAPGAAAATPRARSEGADGSSLPPA